MADRREPEPAAASGQAHDASRGAGSADEARRLPKHRRVFDLLLGQIQSGELSPGDKLPSEAELCRRFDTSRITVAKAVLDLQRMGLVSRRPGAGTHVQSPPSAKGRTFGLLIPELGHTEIFEPICHGMMRSRLARPDALLWGNASSHARESAREAEQLVESFIAQRVAGVFFAPLELAPDREGTNRKVARMLDRAQIPVVLLDRCYMPYPERSHHDLVGVDNRRAGYMATSHLLRLGAQRIAFVAPAVSANTAEARMTGFYEAVRMSGIDAGHARAFRGDAADRSFVQDILDQARPDAIVCQNDLTAAQCMRTLLELGVGIPAQVRIVGMDDVKYASLLPVPLTTIRQDCAGIGTLAMATMLERLDHPELPVRDVLAPIRLIVRQSCGAQKENHA